ncbi:hypothetical protein BpHYR1_024476 [Brachionus plicatilis]|uniref:Uncharacterized protein n=1 Tax=Brachionus plicatilis TaxID=10195 RepID=A0A3M7Q7X9_BRAPC|nr:hypothetical protein BpHYR1_024476 [Brachionus plicatilis]
MHFSKPKAFRNATEVYSESFCSKTKTLIRANIRNERILATRSELHSANKKNKRTQFKVTFKLSRGKKDLY